MHLRPFLLLACAASLAMAQGNGTLSEQPSPFSVWLDLNALSKPGAQKPSMPIWFESFSDEAVPAKDGVAAHTVFRVRLRRMPSLHKEILLRVFFDDVAGRQPFVSTWTESGRELFRSGALGAGAGLPSSESLTVSVEGADYIDIEAAGDGTGVRGVLASSVRDAVAKETLDFQPVAELQDPFGNLPRAKPLDVDQKLFGRVKAAVDTEIARLSQKGEPATQWVFQLAAQPLTSIVTFEVLNADLAAPPLVSVNGSEALPVHVHWPDLSDPGFRGESRPLEQSMRFQYTGWLRAQAVIPGHLLHSGQNSVTVFLPQDSSGVAVRNVELQLKHNWKHFDYILTPASK